MQEMNMFNLPSGTYPHSLEVSWKYCWECWINIETKYMCHLECCNKPLATSTSGMYKFINVSTIFYINIQLIKWKCYNKKKKTILFKLLKRSQVIVNLYEYNNNNCWVQQNCHPSWYWLIIICIRNIHI